ncbi:unnamed protein product [Didymodactylos carnosus]|uniref:Uncharacterized protein n=1 Tax=Didymodactylos carnosus TaxID=1234261 RepID=A0A8S2FVC8_9BILA|nr:unnamed protein product [Didymodactylos carnosus]CAF4345146.1 unnamed protein product [Didymodactylos carnosus]
MKVKYIPQAICMSKFQWNQTGIVVAGGGEGNNKDQLNRPFGIDVDFNTQTMYISNAGGNSLMKWKIGDKHGEFIVKPSNGSKPGPHTLSFPEGVRLDRGGNLYVADKGNNRIQQFCVNSTEGQTIVDRLLVPYDIAFDSQMNLFVSNVGNNSVQKFNRIQ